ncbi:MAG: hypothetical protein WCI51_08340 [Lentisphaerota bacterium]
MKILHQNNIDFAISENGEITCSSTWELICEAIDDWTSFESAVKSWAGNPGEGWRIPDADSEDYTVDTDRVITSIDCSAKSRWIYTVAFKGRNRDIIARMIDYSESVNNRDEREKTATWSIDADSLDAFLPAIGAVLTWAGEFFYCDNINTKKVGITEGRYEVTIIAIDLSTVMLGNPSFSRNAKYESTKSATWKVSNSAYEAFIEAHDVNSDASNWAGSNYFVTSIKAEPRGKLGYDVTVEAKHISVRCIETRREETLKGYDISGNVIREIKYSGRWQVNKDGLEEFKNLTGSSAADWSDEGYIVSRVSPSQISDVEYEISVEASNPDEYQSGGGNPSMLDDRSKLSARTDIEVKCLEFTLSARQAGWMLEKPFKKDTTSKELTDKNVREILKPIVQSAAYDSLSDTEKDIEWTPSRDCPIEMASGANYADKKWVDKTFTCIALEYTQYSKGELAQQLSQLETRRDKIPYIQYGQINGLTKSWKRLSYNVEKILDNKGDAWWKESYTLIACPHTWKWNAAYHEGQG